MGYKNSELVSRARIVAGCLVCLVGFCSQASAQSASPFQIRFRATSYTCAVVSGKMVSGRINRADGAFVPYSIDMKVIKAKIKLASASKKSALKKKLAALKSKSAAGNRVCKGTSPGQQPTPTPGSTPGATSAPTPKPTATPATGNFDAQGNVTAKGKLKFGIPSNLSANKNAGQIVYNAARSSNLGMKSCGACHTERANRTYSYMQAILPSPIMLINLSPGDLANLTAYVNRTQTP